MDSRGDLDSHLSDYQTDTSSPRGTSCLRATTMSSKQSDTGYNTIASNFDQLSHSTYDRYTMQSPLNASFYENSQKVPTKSPEPASTTVLATLLERYEKTLRERQRTIAMLDNELLDIDDVIKHYREKIRTFDTNQVNLVRKQNYTFSSLKEVGG